MQRTGRSFRYLRPNDQVLVSFLTSTKVAPRSLHVSPRLLSTTLEGIDMTSFCCYDWCGWTLRPSSLDALALKQNKLTKAEKSMAELGHFAYPSWSGLASYTIARCRGSRPHIYASSVVSLRQYMYSNASGKQHPDRPRPFLPTRVLRRF
jgi:hypothetical protein